MFPWSLSASVTASNDDLELNRSLRDFCGNHATNQTVDSWFRSHPYHESMYTKDEDKWMAK